VASGSTLRPLHANQTLIDVKKASGLRMRAAEIFD
jgi:hypothetical protein